MGPNFEKSKLIMYVVDYLMDCYFFPVENPLSFQISYVCHKIDT